MKFLRENFGCHEKAGKSFYKKILTDKQIAQHFFMKIKSNKIHFLSYKSDSKEGLLNFIRA